MLSNVKDFRPRDYAVQKGITLELHYLSDAFKHFIDLEEKKRPDLLLMLIIGRLTPEFLQL